MRHDLARLLVPGRVLTADDVTALANALGAPAWQIRQHRLDARDNAIRTALGRCAAHDRTSAAKMLARALGAFLRGVPGNPALTPLLATILELHADSAPLSWQQIVRIGRDGRSPSSAHNLP